MMDNKKRPVTKRSIRRQLAGYADKRRAALLQRFFKTGPGEYGEGDRFLGIVVPDVRKVARANEDAGKDILGWLLRSPFHEERFLGLMILVRQFNKGSDAEKAALFKFYTDHMRSINNWDLVDLTAPHIIGAFLEGKDRKLLYALARSDDLWERRIAILATFYYIKKGDFDDSLTIARMLLDDKEDLIHKAAGWMLREIGKRDITVFKTFLDAHHRVMPRTMLRYSIERLPERTRAAYMARR